MSWKVVKDENVVSHWKCGECDSTVGVEPDWYEQNGTPACWVCDRDMTYSHTEVDCG